LSFGASYLLFVLDVRTLVRHEFLGLSRVTVDPYEWNERALRGRRNAGFEQVSEHPADAEHLQPWVQVLPAADG